MSLVRSGTKRARRNPSTATCSWGDGSANRWAYRTATLLGWNSAVFWGMERAGSAASMTPFVDGLQSRGIAATAIDLPKRRAEDAIPAFHARGPARAVVVVGGQSFGGRVASLAAAEPGAPYAALVLFSYPLHPPGSPDKDGGPDAHWPQIRCPVLLLSGESDPFAKIDLLRAAVPAPRRTPSS